MIIIDLSLKIQFDDRISNLSKEIWSKKVKSLNMPIEELSIENHNKIDFTVN